MNSETESSSGKQSTQPSIRPRPTFEDAPQVKALNEVLEEYKNLPYWFPVEKYMKDMKPEVGEKGCIMKKGRVIRRIF